MSIFGQLNKKMHPAHVMLVHFPSALYPFSLLMDALGWYYVDLSISNTAYYALLTAFISSLLATIFGVIDYLKILPDSGASNTAAWHGGLNVLWMFGFAVMLKLRYHSFMGGNLPSLFYLSALLFLIIGLMFSNHLGGDLVFRHGVGVQKKKE